MRRIPGTRSPGGVVAGGSRSTTAPRSCSRVRAYRPAVSLGSVCRARVIACFRSAPARITFEMYTARSAWKSRVSVPSGPSTSTGTPAASKSARNTSADRSAHVPGQTGCFPGRCSRYLRRSVTNSAGRGWTAPLRFFENSGGSTTAGGVASRSNQSGTSAASSAARNPVPTAVRYSITRSAPSSPRTTFPLRDAVANNAPSSAGLSSPRRRRWSSLALRGLSRANGVRSRRSLSTSHRANCRTAWSQSFVVPAAAPRSLCWRRASTVSRG